MPRISTRAWLAAAVLLAAAPLHAQAPAPAAQTSSAASSALSPATRDSAQMALRQRFAADLLAAAGAGAAGLVVLAADSATGRIELKLVRATVTEAALAPAVERVRAELKALAAAGPLLWYVRLDLPPMPAGPTRRPVIDNPREVRALVNRFVEQNFTRIFQGRRGLRVDLEMVVAREGDVAYARVVRSSGNPAVDREALRIAPTMRFQPARVGRQPVDRQITFPLYFVVGEA
ncbi:MAG TPA: energy transducer TonB [Longimicrobium sp.]|jgi:TonB family protein